MQKNNKNIVLSKVKKNRVSTFILLILFMLTVNVSEVTFAQRVQLEETLIARISSLEVEMTALIEQSELAEGSLSQYVAQIQSLNVQLEAADSQSIQLQQQSNDLLTIISNAVNEIALLDSRQIVLNSEIGSLDLQIAPLTQQRLEVVTASTAKMNQFTSDLLQAQSSYDEFQKIGVDLSNYFDSRLAILNLYLPRVNTDQLRTYIEQYINLLQRLKLQYAVWVDSSKLVYSNKISQLQEASQQLQTETTILLATLDETLNEKQAAVLVKREEFNSAVIKIAELNEEKTASQAQYASVIETMNALQSQVTQMTVDLENAETNKTELTATNNITNNQIQTILAELTQLLLEQEEIVVAENREQGIANAMIALNAMEMNTAGRCQSNSSDIYAVACFESDERQIVRISHSQLLELGVNLLGVPKNNIGALSNGEAVPVFVSAADLFNESSFIEVLAKGNDSIYSDSMSYMIYVDFAEENPLAATTSHSGFNTESITDGMISTQALITDSNLPIKDSYTEKFHYEKDENYSISGLSDFGWIDADSFHYIYGGQTRTVDLTFELDSHAKIDRYADVVVNFAKSAFSGDSAKTIVQLNGVQLGDEHIDEPGRSEDEISFDINPGLLQVGENTISLIVTNIGNGRMSFQFDKFVLSYERSLVAKEEAISFEADSGEYTISNSNSQDVVVFKQLETGQVERFTPSIQFTSSQQTLTAEFSSEEQPLLTSFMLPVNENVQLTIDNANTDVELSLPRSYQDIKSPQAEYLIISHPDFVNTQAMTDLVNLRQQEYSVQVVDVDEIYAQYSQGVFDANAIKKFIGDKITNSSTQMVLLVGDDTYDYKNKLETGEESFIPSMYLMYPRVMAADSIYVDHNNDQLPEIAIGRFPVETPEEFANLVNKTMMFSQNTYERKAVLATNHSDGYGVTHYHPVIEKIFHSSWNQVSALMTEDTIEDRDRARGILINSVGYHGRGGSSGLFVYTGHNSYDVGPMFISEDISQLSNQAFPTSAVLIDSFTGFYIADEMSATTGVMAEDLLVADGVGAAAVFAPSSTVGLQSVQTKFIYRISRNYTYGEAYLAAMQVSYRSGAASYNLLGDPGLRLKTY